MAADPNILADLLAVPRGPSGEPQWPTSTAQLFEAAKAKAELGARLEYLEARAPSVPLTSPTPTQSGAVGKGQGYGTGMVNMRTLRYIRESSQIAIAIHEARQHHLQRYSARSYGQPGQVGWRVVHRDFRNPKVDVPRRFAGPIQQAERILSRTIPHQRVHGMGDTLRGLWDDYAALNRPVLERVRDTNGEIAAIRPVDGAAVWEASAFIAHYATGHAAEMRRIQEQYGASTQGLLDGLSAAVPQMQPWTVDFHRHRYLWVENEMVMRAFDDDEIIVGSALTSTDHRYGAFPPSKLERALNASVYADQILDYNMRFFTEGWQSNWLIFVPEEARAETVRALNEALAARGQGNQGAHQPVTIGASSKDVTLQNLTPGLPRDYAFEALVAFFATIHCAIYQIDPSSIYMKPWGAGQAPALNEANRSEEIVGSREGGLPGDLEHIRQALLNPIVQDIHPDLEVVIDSGDYDPKKAIEILKDEIGTTKTRNQAIIQQGGRPIEPYVADEDWDGASLAERAAHYANPYNHVGSPMEAIQLAQAVSAAMQPPQGGPGPEGPPEGYPDGPDAPEGAPEDQDWLPEEDEGEPSGGRGR